MMRNRSSTAEQTCVFCASPCSPEDGVREGNGKLFESSVFLEDQLTLSQFYERVIFSSEYGGGGGALEGGGVGSKGEDEVKVSRRKPGPKSRPFKKKSEGSKRNALENVFSVCPRCMNLVRKAAAMEVKVREAEIRVRDMQSKVLKELEELRRKIRSFYGELLKFGRIVNRARSQSQPQPSSRGGRSVDGTGSGSILELRKNITTVINALEFYMNLDPHAELLDPEDEGMCETVARKHFEAHPSLTCVLCCSLYPQPGNGGVGESKSFITVIESQLTLSTFYEKVIYNSDYSGNCDGQQSQLDCEETTRGQRPGRKKASSIFQKRPSKVQEEFSVCPKCIVVVRKATEAEGEVRKAEIRVGGLQSRILTEVRELREGLSRFHLEMVRIKEVMKKSAHSEDCLLLRGNISKIIRTLESYKAIASIGSTLESYKAIASIGSPLEPEVETEYFPEPEASTPSSPPSVVYTISIRKLNNEGSVPGYGNRCENAEDDMSISNEGDQDTISSAPSPIPNAESDEELEEEDDDLQNDDSEGNGNGDDPSWENFDFSSSISSGDDSDADKDFNDEEQPVSSIGEDDEIETNKNELADVTAEEVSSGNATSAPPPNDREEMDVDETTLLPDKIDLLLKDPLKDIDFTGMSWWRRKVITVVLRRAAGGTFHVKAMNMEEHDPRRKYKMEYNKETGFLSVGGINDLPIHDDDDSLSCSKCPFRLRCPPNTTYVPYSRLFDHVVGHHLEPFKCLTCQTEYKSLAYYRTHMKIHNAPQELTCDICGIILCNKDSLRDHMRTHMTPEEKEEAIKAGKIKSKRKNGEEASKGKAGRPSSSTTTTSTSKAPPDPELFKGMSAFRRLIVQRVLKNGGFRKFTSKSKSMENDPRDKYKMQYHPETGFLSIGQITNLVINDEEEILSCSKCKYWVGEPVGSRRADGRLFLHVLGNHLGGFPCHICSFHNVNWNKYLIHMKTHEVLTPGENLILCDVCGKGCPSQVTLERHHFHAHMTDDEKLERRRRKMMEKLKLKRLSQKPNKTDATYKEKKTLPTSNPFQDIDFTKMSPYRRKVVMRVLRAGASRRTFATEHDPRDKFVMDYNPKTGFLAVGSITNLIINDKEECLCCSRCSFRVSEKPKKNSSKYRPRPAENGLFNHVLGRHLKAIQCHLCNKKFASWEGYRIHKKVHSQPDKFICDICGMPLLSSTQSFNNHRATHMSKEEKAELVKSGKLKVYRYGKTKKCLICGKYFRTAEERLEHKEKEHPNNEKEKKDVPCPFCGKLFAKSYLRYHKYSVCGKKSIECNLCEGPTKFRCNTQARLATHKRIAHHHHGRGKKEETPSRRSTRSQRKTRNYESDD